mmetsp:Transcript_33360/g.37295  ORF Transcript_33360/g.37295 Transcript_33360/m.37295 type:complete len:691 (-) Transcript_33360:200-2272(-)|eukprot:CAMPEP_0170780654 /NCGR_PEP_ID=MMETSP0733-20121128/13730_1 /TAXON_ID=186038 /ORGANISM="Fragilariopsis kerguelensis, Strain L26-C5" /LENGTH=690 /DNA_ID=CAMNT_0011124539 /DNA_START=260 /DNA_END=2332 /DNA_ORIENTATION=+
MTSISSTGKSKKVASRVFGQNIFNEMNTSLCYTPSPLPSEIIKKNLTGALSSATSKTNTNLITSILEESESSISQSTPTPTVLFKQDKENISEKRVSFAQDEKQNDDNGFVGTAISITSKSSSTNSIRNAELNRLRASRKKSPMRRDLVKRTEEAIDDATTSLTSSMLKEKGNDNTLSAESVFQSLNASRTAKLQVLFEKSKEAKSVRFQWDQENTEAKSLQEQADDHRRQIRAIQKKLTSAHFKDKARHDESQKMQRYANLEKEYTFKSEVFQDHQQTLKEGRDQNRKMSIDARAKIRRNKREGEEILKTMRLEEEQAMFEVRADLHRSRMECKKANAGKRRLSFQFRAGDARRICDMRTDWKEKNLHEKHVGYEMERAAATDVDSYKKQMRKEEQDDFKERNRFAFECRKREKEKAYEASIEEHEIYELKWAGERDAEAYKKRMNEERRKSLAGRNKESVRHANAMEELRTLAKEKEAESFILKFGAENDAKAYLAKLAEERRQSLQLRGREARKARQYEEEEHSKAIENALIEGALQSDCQKDVENYKANCAERRRKSFQFRGKQGRLQRLEEEERHLEQMKKEEENSKLERLAQKDVQEYYKDCKKRRRKSLALRAKEMRQHVEWKKGTGQKQVEERAHTTYLNSLDIQHVALAKERDRARKAMEALLNAGCNFKGNPFGNLLNDR